MQFSATPRQLRQLMANAVNASVPMGMGHLHYTPTVYTADQFDPHAEQLDVYGDVNLDYIDGRMTKLRISRVNDGTYEIPDDPRYDYQSWCRTYPTTAALIASAVAE